MSDMIERDLSVERWREYDFGGRVYKIDKPAKLFYRPGGETHRIVTADGVAHCVPAPGRNGCVLRWKDWDTTEPVKF
jgi:hypothetical protein